MLLVALALAVVGGLCGCGDKEGRTVALVNGQPLSRADFYGVLERDYGRKALLQAILEKVVEQEAKKQNISVSDEELEREAERQSEAMGGREQLLKALGAQGIAEDTWKKQVRLELLSEKLRTKGVTVTEAEIKDYWEKNRAQFDEPEQVKLRLLVTATKAQAEEAYKKLMAGEDFAAVVRQYAIDEGLKATGGDLGWQSRESMRQPILAAQAFALKVGQLSKPFQVEQQWVIVRADDRKEAKKAQFEQEKEKIRRLLTLQKGEDPTAYYSRLLGNSDIEIVWKRFKPLEGEFRALKQQAGPGALPPIEPEVGPEPAPAGGGNSSAKPQSGK